jgi:hypothetical protein
MNKQYLTEQVQAAVQVLNEALGQAYLHGLAPLVDVRDASGIEGPGIRWSWRSATCMPDSLLRVIKRGQDVWVCAMCLARGRFTPQTA